ncbi:uncharacterized protein RSE6_11061 [Rhynchosporium secalis]|uniref:Uncharacterized protein n=1 Tax=Rhynchosporium secalis TaxID=38038 RepID=A0A1E1MM21_RHYSE|nr:uncharacterized protein RSE6_11061 [Rhynchosporium secalis]
MSSDSSASVFDLAIRDWQRHKPDKWKALHQFEALKAARHYTKLKLTFRETIEVSSISSAAAIASATETTQQLNVFRLRLGCSVIDTSLHISLNEHMKLISGRNRQ